MEDATERPLAAYLPDDLTVNILSRLPAKSLYRFMCVSQSWHSLVSDLVFTDTTSLPCFFFLRRHDNGIQSTGFVTTEGDSGPPLFDSALSFLPASSCREITLLDSCNGLLLLRCSLAITAGATLPPRPAFYAVCNPATEEWVALPQPSLEPGFNDYYDKACSAALGFDPSISPHFHVFQLEEKEIMYNYFVKAVEIYSSETGKWTRKQMGWDPRKYIYFDGHKTYFNGFLHLTCSMFHHVIAMVDVKGQTWRTIDVPSDGTDDIGFVSHSQGRLIYVDNRTRLAGKLVIYALEDHDSDRWTLKCKVRNTVLFGLGNLPYCVGDNPVVAFHPTRDVFFFYDREGERLMSYDMNQKRAHFIRVLEDVADVDIDEIYPFFLYVPVLLDVRHRQKSSFTISHTNLTS